MKKTAKRILYTIEIAISGMLAITFIVFYFQFLWGLPVIQLTDFKIMPQASIITDRENNEIFRFYNENRRQVTYDAISISMRNAIVATEDNGFRVNEGVERQSILRATINNIKHFFGAEKGVQGASTITQQLIKNIMLTKEKKIKRKLQEIILAQKLTSQRTKAIRKQYPQKTEKEINQKTKEEVLTTYLNYVYYGNHSYGIASAAENYFHTTPQKLTLLQSVILSSLPQAPSKYNPLTQSQTVLGNRKRGDDIILPHKESKELEEIRKKMKDKNIVINNIESCLADIKDFGTIKLGDEKVNYTIGRKDRVLCRMYEDKYIKENDIKRALIESTTLKIYTATNNIKNPHFVFRIQKFLQQSEIFKDYHIDDKKLSQGGWTIRTSLDPNDQKIANNVVANNMKHVYINKGNNRALMHVDSGNGDVLSYVGSADYYNNEIKGKNDMIQAKRQIGSTIKPLIYAYLFKNFGRTIDAKILDMPLPKAYAKNGQPRNSDRTYRGRIGMKIALASSRNIPLIRLFYALGKESTFVPYLKSLGFTDLQEEKKYGYSLLLGAGEGNMMQLAGAYIELSSDEEEKVPQINPILSIKNNKGESIYEKRNDLSYYKKRIIPKTVSYMIRSIISNIGHAPKDWYYYLIIPSMERTMGSKSYAIKTGTSEKKVGKRSYPNDARMATYTNRDIIISWAGHTDGKALGKEGYGLYLNHRIIKQYYRELIENKKLLGKQKERPKNYKGYNPSVKGKNPSNNEINLLQVR